MRVRPTMPAPALAVLAAVLAGSVAIGWPAPIASQDDVTYDDTPVLPGTSYRVHGERPWPPVVTPGGGPGAAPSEAPSDAIVLFDGEDLSEWTGGDGDAAWKLVDGAMEVNGTGALTTRRELGDVQLHLEFATPAEVRGSSQGRGNSGVFFMTRYEVQILDSHDNPTYPDGQCAALYGQHPPAVNACRPPGEWQSYDVVFRAPRFRDGELVSPASVTVFHNGVLVHDRREFLGATTHRALPRYEPHAPKGPIRLQDHGNPVRFRNVWVRELED